MDQSSRINSDRFYAEFERLRKESPVSRDAESAPWRVARYDDVQQVLRDDRTFSSNVTLRARDPQESPSMLFSDPPEHNRLRKIVSRTFSPQRITDQRELIAERCEQLVSQMVQQDQPDLVKALASPLPVTVIADMLGVTDGNMQQFKREHLHETSLVEHDPEVLSRFGGPVQLAVNIQPNA